MVKADQRLRSNKTLAATEAVPHSVPVVTAARPAATSGRNKATYYDYD